MANPSEYDPAKTRLSEDDAARLALEVVDVAAAGRSLAPGLRATAEEMRSGRLRSALASVADALDRGESVDDALAAQGRGLPAYVRGLIAVGTRTGKVGHVLARLNSFNNVGADLRRRLLISLAYPLLTLSIATAIFTFICTWLVPSFESIFKDFGIAIPMLTKIILSVSHVFSLSWPWGGELLIGLVVMWVLFYFVLGGAGRRAFISRLPVVGAVWRYTSLAEFCHLLGLLLESEVPLPSALRLTGDGVRDSSIDRACAGMARDVEGGMTLSQSLSRQPIFPKGLARVLRWAEGHRSLPDALHMAGEMFETSARGHGSLAGTVLAVFVVFWVLFVVAAVVIGLFIPLITLISRLSG